MRRLSENAHTVDRIQLIGRVTKQLVFIGRNIVHSQTTNIAQGFRQSRTSYIIRRSGLKLERQFVESRLFKRHGSNHLPSSLVRRQLVQPFFLAIQDTDTGRTVNLMTGEHIELGIQILHIHFQMGNGLRSVDQYRNLVIMGFFSDLLYRIDRTEHIRHMCNRDKFCPFRKKTTERIHAQLAFFIHRNHFQRDPFTGSLYLPGNDIGMVFHHRNDHFVAGRHTFVGKAGSNQVDRLCRPTRENNLVGRAGVQELLHGLACILMRFRRRLAQEMNAAVNIGIHIIIATLDLFHHTAWLLGCRSVVEVNKRLIVYLMIQNREILPDRLYI